MTVHNEAAKEVRAQVTDMAADAFSRHVVTQVAPAPFALFKCSRPGSWVYGFFLGFPPGAVVFYGDIGEAILRPYDADSLSWLRGAVGSEGYLLEKVKPQIPLDFYLKDARAWLAELETEREHSEEEREDDLREALDREDNPRHAWAGALSDLGLLDGTVPGDGPSASAFWLVAALRWFVAHEPPVQESGGGQ